MWAKRYLQIIVALAALVPVGAGIAGINQGPSMAGALAWVPVDLDSHFHYLSGLLLGIGLAYWSTVPAIETKGDRFRMLSFIVVTGGLARLLSLLHAGRPSNGMIFGLAMELVVTPLLALWQFRLARTAGASRRAPTGNSRRRSR